MSGTQPTPEDLNASLRDDASAFAKDDDALEARLARKAKWASAGAFVSDALLDTLEVAIPFIPGLTEFAPALEKALAAAKAAIDASLAEQKVVLPQTTLDGLGGLLNAGVKLGVPGALHAVLPPDAAQAAGPALLQWAEKDAGAALTAFASVVNGKG